MEYNTVEMQEKLTVKDERDTRGKIKEYMAGIAINTVDNMWSLFIVKDGLVKIEDTAMEVVCFI
jgi:hypothetical protein